MAFHAERNDRDRKLTPIQAEYEAALSVTTSFKTHRRIRKRGSRGCAVASRLAHLLMRPQAESPWTGNVRADRRGSSRHLAVDAFDELSDDLDDVNNSQPSPITLVTDLA